MVEKTASGRVRTKSPSSPRLKRQRVKKEKLPSLKTLKRNAQRKIELINNETYVSNFIEDNYKTISIERGKLIMNMNYKDYEIRNEVTDFMRQMNKILYR